MDNAAKDMGSKLKVSTHDVKRTYTHHYGASRNQQKIHLEHEKASTRIAIKMIPITKPPSKNKFKRPIKEPPLID